MTFQPSLAAGLLRADLLLSSAQLLSIFTTPVTIVPAPGAGLAIVPVSLALNVQFKGTPYVDHAGSLVLGAGGISFLTQSTAGFWDQGSSRNFFGAVANTVQASSAWANQPMTLFQNTANPTGGNGTMAVTLSYLVAPAL